MAEGPRSGGITIRPAVSEDAEGIVAIYMQSADYHAALDPERYWIPDAKTILARYRDGQQHSSLGSAKATTLVAELSGEIVGFVDARLTSSPDPMHRDMIYCHLVEIAISRPRQGHGIGTRLLRAAENWGRLQGATLASLEYLATNKAAKAFYGRSGYDVGSIFAIKRLS